ncbi:MAG: adenylate kinase [Candidatus Altiarchaeota archaeon]
MANIVFLGPPGSGKGTQAETLSKEFGWPQISPGNILRHAMEEGSDLGRDVKGYLDKGALVPDRMIDGIIKARLAKPDCRGGFILDGFPRDREQAEALEDIAKIDVVFDIQVSDETLIRRLGGRRVCDCGQTYHIINRPPKREGICDACGKRIYRRKDDDEDTIRNRLRVYHRETEPLIDYYWKKGILAEIDGGKAIEYMHAAIRDRTWTISPK